MSRNIFLIFLFASLSLGINAQVVREVPLANPSFEGEAAPSKVPAQWTDCGYQTESPPDVQPGAFGVDLPAAEGHTYVGMVVRDNSTYEALGQRLRYPLSADTCYQLDLYLGRAKAYMSMSRSSKQRANFVTPVILRIWGDDTEMCARGDILAVSEPIKWYGWHRQRLILQPVHRVHYLTLEAYYAPDFGRGVNGHLLIDGLSSLKPMPCSVSVAPVPGKQRVIVGHTVARDALAELRAAVAQQVPRLRFEGYMLSQESFEALKALAPVLQAHSQYALVLALKADSAKDFAKRKKALKAAFKAAGVPLKQVVLLRFEPAGAFAFSWISTEGTVWARLRRIQ